MKLNDLGFEKITPLGVVDGLFIRNLPMKEYQKYLQPILLVTKANRGLEKKLTSEDAELTDDDIKHAEEMSKDFLPAVNDFIKALICDEDSQPFDDDDIFDVLPQSTAMDIFQAAASHISGKKGN